ncbi:MAG: NAD(+) synthase [Oscillospiraceae bacterium]|jgi:NAD+ synthase|nr:NAD(+) synthase [Oscillospiraceae bacterium]
MKNSIVAWIKECFKENGGDKAVVGISGGKDSSVVAALCVQALGRENVIGVLMPQGVQPDIDCAYDLTEFLGIEYKEVNIGSTVAVLSDAIGTVIPQAIINIPPRVRMTVLYAVAAEINGRVANTCNCSEDYVGYSTKYGDSAGDFSPLGALTVTEVLRLGEQLDLPHKLLYKVPADGLTGKTDEENLGFTYEVLDEYIRKGICPDAAVKAKIDILHQKNLHKIRPIPTFKPH